MELKNERKSEIILDLLRELMSEMKSSTGSKLLPSKTTEISVEAIPLGEVEEPEVEEVEDESSESPEHEAGETELEEVLEHASEEEPKSSASRRLAKLAAMNKKA